MRDRLVERVRTVLRDLEMLNETRAASLRDRDRVSEGKPGSRVPEPIHTDLAHFSQRMSDLCDQAERRVREAHKGQANSSGQIPDVTPAQQDYWLIESGQYEGVDYRRAAEALGLRAETVYAARKKRGLDPRTGRQVAA